MTQALGEDEWIETIDLSKAVKLDGFKAQQDGIVSAIQNSAWMDTTIPGEELDQVVQGFADSADWDEANAWFARLYDLADRERVWLQTF